LRRSAISRSRVVNACSSGEHGAGPGLLGLDDGGRPFLGLAGDGDRLVGLGDLDRPVLLHRQLADVAVADEAGLGEAALGGDAGTLDLLAGDDLGLLGGLALGDLQRLQRPLALDPGLVDPLLAALALALDLGTGRDLRPARLDVGLRHLDRLPGERDLALALGDLDRAAARHLQLLLLLALADALGLDLERRQHLRPLDLLAGGDARLLDLQPGGDLGRLEGPPLVDLHRLQHPLARQPGLVDGAVAGEAGGLGLLVAGDLGLAAGRLGPGHLGRLGGQRDLALALCELHLAPAGNLQLLLLALAVDPLALDGKAEGDLLALGLLAALQLGQLDRAPAHDLALLDLLLIGDAGLGEGPLLGDAGLLGRLGGGDLRLLGLLLAHRPLAGELGPLHRPADLDLALLLQPGIFALPVDLQDAALRIEILIADLDHRLLLDEIAHLAAHLDRLGELGQALGVEGIGGIEEFQAGLVDVDEGDVLQLQPVIGESLGGLLAHPDHELAAPLVNLLQAHLGRRGAERRGELALEEIADAVRLHRPAAEGLGGQRDRLAGRADAEEELGDQVDPHPVAGDQRGGLAAPHLDAHHVHVDWRHLVQDRDDEGAAVDDHLLAAEAGAHEGALLGRAAVEPSEQVDGDDDDDGKDDQPQDDRAEDLTAHGYPSPARRAARPFLFR
jgi:hypothetical protein